MLKLREKARINYEMANAKSKLSRLNNSAARPALTYSPGQLVMVWRQKNRPGKVTGSWLGPVRLLLTEGGTSWLATGSTLIRARLNQIRPCTSREELQASLEGTAVMTTPTTLESLLRTFTGRNYLNITGEVPSERQRQDDIQGGEVRVDPGDQPRQDTWRIIFEENRKWLVRTHHAPRLALFSPLRLQDSPISIEELTGKRIAIVRSMLADSPEAKIEDNFKDGQDPHRHLTERWKGETRLEVKQAEPSSSLKKPHVKKTIGKEKKPATKSDAAGSCEPETPVPVPVSAASPQVLLPEVPQLDDAETPQLAQGCVLRGGHEGAHRDFLGLKFSWRPDTGRVYVEEPEDSSSSSSSSSDSSDELMSDDPRSNHRQRRSASSKRRKFNSKEADGDAFKMEIVLESSDIDYLSKHPMKAGIWLSKKMETKGKEAQWSRLTLEERKSFDGAQAKELSNVLAAKAVRSLTASEEANLDYKRVMQMRWVLTHKSDNTPKARLVVLGYQAHNVASVQASAPTMARLSRNLLLTVCANEKFKLRSGDVTSAFLQAAQSLEDEDLVVWAPAELATLYGADPQYPVKALKICRAFYGLVHAPRKWYDHVCSTLVAIGWKKLLSDGCLFTLHNSEGKLCGIAGIHVDDFLLGGCDEDTVFQEAERKLQEAYKWGKWQDTNFEFAGTNITQHEDFSIEVSQRSYLEKWLEEVPIPPDRQKCKKSKLTPSEISSLRGILGTMSWKASQSGPHYVADVSLLLSEIPYATIETLLKANKLAREILRDAQQSLWFPSWGVPWQSLAVVTWADASTSNRPDRSSTMGLISGIAPKKILEGEEVTISLVNWRSGKTPRQCLGSNGAEIQAITEAEDVTFKIRGLLVDIYGVPLDRGNLSQQIREHSHGAVVMDSRGVFDAAARNSSALHGLRSSRAGYELALSVIQAKSVGTHFRWVNGLAQLADALTKSNSRKVLLHMMSQGQRWRLVFDEKFTAGKKIRKQEMLKKMREAEAAFLSAVDMMCVANRYPRIEDEDPRCMGGVLTELDL
eukprot:Skav212300  [mRNA]  locus=scaffold732:645059:648265:- [translate_table: standard]